MIHVAQLQFYVRNDVLQLNVHRYHKECCLLFINHTFALIYQGRNILALFVKVHQLLFLDGKGWLVLVGIVDVALQVDDIPKCCERNIPQYSFHVTQVSVLPAWIILTQIILDGIIQVPDTFLYTGNIYLLINLQYILKELQINILKLHEVSILTYHAITLQELNAFILLARQVASPIIPKR